MAIKRFYLPFSETNMEIQLFVGISSGLNYCFGQSALATAAATVALSSIIFHTLTYTV
jgi:hypothetical protein